LDSEIIKYVVQCHAYLTDDGDGEITLIETRLAGGYAADSPEPSVPAQLQALVAAAGSALQAATELAEDTDHLLYLASALTEHADKPALTRMQHTHKKPHDPEEN
jgi:hypothetical protein